MSFTQLNKMEISLIKVDISTGPLTVASLRFFRGGGTPGPYQGDHAPPQGVRGRKPPDGREVSFFKTMLSIRK